MSEAAAATAPEASAPATGAPEAEEQHGFEEVTAAAEGEERDTPSSEESAEPTPAEIKKYRVKVDGNEVEVDEDELTKSYELKKASHVRMQKAQEEMKRIEEERKQYKQLLTALEEDPWKVFEALGLDPDGYAEQRLIEKMKLENMSPEERALHEKEERLRQREREIEEFEEAKRLKQEELAKQEQEELTYKAVKEIDNEIGEVLRATGLKPTPRVVSRIAEIMLSHLDTSDGERLDASKAFGIVRTEMTEEISEYLAALPPEQLVQTLPKSVLDAVRKHDLDKARGTNPFKQQSASHERPSTEPSTRGAKRMSTDSLFATLEKRLK